MNLQDIKIDKEKLRKTIMPVSIAVAALIVVSFAIILPSVKKMAVLQTEIRERKSAIEELESDIRNRQSIEKKINDLDKKISLWQDGMPENTPDWLILKINSIAGTMGIIFDTISPRDIDEQVEQYKLKALQLEFKSDYHKLGKFLNQLEGASPFIDVIDLNITGNSLDQSNHLVKITVGAYVKKEK